MADAESETVVKTSVVSPPGAKVIEKVITFSAGTQRQLRINVSVPPARRWIRAKATFAVRENDVDFSAEANFEPGALGKITSLVLRIAYTSSPTGAMARHGNAQYRIGGREYEQPLAIDSDCQHLRGQELAQHLFDQFLRELNEGQLVHLMHY